MWLFTNIHNDLFSYLESLPLKSTSNYEEEKKTALDSRWFPQNSTSFDSSLEDSSRSGGSCTSARCHWGRHGTWATRIRGNQFMNLEEIVLRVFFCWYLGSFRELNLWDSISPSHIFKLIYFDKFQCRAAPSQPSWKAQGPSLKSKNMNSPHPQS